MCTDFAALEQLQQDLQIQNIIGGAGPSCENRLEDVIPDRMKNGFQAQVGSAPGIHS